MSSPEATQQNQTTFGSSVSLSVAEASGATPAGGGQGGGKTANNKHLKFFGAFFAKTIRSGSEHLPIRLSEALCDFIGANVFEDGAHLIECKETTYKCVGNMLDDRSTCELLRGE